MSFWTAVKDLVFAFNPVSFLINTAVSWAIGEILSSDVERDIDKRYQGTLLNKQSNNAQIPVIYGERKVGGTRVFMATSGTDNAYLYLVLVLCEGEIEAIGDVYINDVISTDSRYSGLVTINKHLGTDGQAADTMLTGAGIDWTTDHKLRGLAYVACKFKWDANVFGSVPTVHCVVQGRKVYNPATGSTAYSTNPALCWRDYLTNSRYGKGLATSAIDDTAVNAAATKCNTLVTPYSGATQIRLFECNAAIDTSRSIMDNCRVLLSGMRALMPYSEGKYGLIVEDQKVGASVFSFTEDHIIGGISIEGERKQDKYNRVIATFANPNKNWQSDQIEWPKTNSTDHNNYLSADNNTELVGRIDLATITNPYTAEDIAELVVKRSRDGLKVGMVVSSEGLICAVGDIISITHSTPAWSAKDFRVMGVTLNADCTVQLECVEHQDNIYPWGTKTQEPSSPNTNLPVHSLNNIMAVYSQANNSSVSPSTTFNIGSGSKFWSIFTTPESFSLSNKKLHVSFTGTIDYENFPFNWGYYYERWIAGWVLADVNGVPLSVSSSQYIDGNTGYSSISIVDGGFVSLGVQIQGQSGDVGFDETFFTIAAQEKYPQGFKLAANTHYKISDGSIVTTDTTQFKLVFGIFTKQISQYKNVSSWSNVNTAVTVFSR
jgi:hypothetical protein